VTVVTDRFVTRLITVVRVVRRICLLTHAGGGQVGGQPFPFSLDLGLAELRRRAAVVEALGDTWDPAAALAEETGAYEMLYSGLDAEQQRVYDELVRAGVLPDRQVRDDAA
jgi:Family of unknown function (DUF6400)